MQNFSIINYPSGQILDNIPLYKYLRNVHGNKLCNIFKSYAKYNKKLATLIQSRNFLVECRKYGIIPDCISNTSRNVKRLFDCDLYCQNGTDTKISKRLAEISQNLHIRLLNLMITEKCTKIKKYKMDLKVCKEGIVRRVETHISESFLNSQEGVFKRFTDKSKTTHNKKLIRLKTTMLEKLQIKLNKKWFVNHTTVEFTEETSWLLSLGKKYALPYIKKELPLLNVIADSENCIRIIKDTGFQKAARANLCSRLNNFYKNYRNKLADKFILRIYEDTIKTLSQHKDIIVTQSDKGGVTVVMYKRDYVDKLRDLVHDRNTYRIIRKDPTLSNQTKNNMFAKYLKEGHYINEWEKSKLTTYTAVAPKLYGLPKIHKHGLPLRPIVSSINSPAYALSKFLVKILNHMTADSIYNVKNSTELKDRLSNVRMEVGEVLVSFDVVSLFTNIPVQLCTKIIEREWDRLKSYTDIPMKKFLEMLKFCIEDNNYFSFNGNLHRQVYGTPMGSPLSPILADIVMEDLLDNVLKELDFDVKLLVKYVDDLLVMLPEEKLGLVHQLMNRYHEKIQFTVEKEENGNLPYLDIRIVINNGELLTDWYQKETSSGRILNFFSKHPRHQVINTAKNFVRRVLGISSPRYHYKNKHIITKALKENNFPKKIISKLITEYYNNSGRQKNDNKENRNTEPTKYMSATYIPHLSENIRGQILEDQSKTDMAFKTGKTVGRLFSKLKDSTKKDLYTDIVYKIPCGGKKDEVCGMSYIGTTKQFLKNRISNHKSDIKCDNANKTALAQHVIELRHEPDFQKTAILSTEKNMNKRLILEALHIQTTDNTINRKTDVENLSDLYSSLLNSFEKTKRNTQQCRLVS